MNKKWEVVIGIEIHVELNTHTKMFSAAPNNFNAKPNACVSFVDVAYPGTLPLVNKNAVKKAIKLAKALSMKVDNELHFDRKNYFYADLPKGYQITQDRRPIGTNGFLPVLNNKKILIQKIQIEEDTAQSYHQANETLLNYNRAGVPLVEIVTYPVIRSSQEAVAYIDTIRKLVKILKISDGKMEEGSLRTDINISLRPEGQEKFNTKVEIKNLNSLSNVVKAIAFEINEQKNQYDNNQQVQQATKRFDESRQKLITMRVKTDAADYKFFPEPNIPVIKLSNSFLNSIEMPKLPWEIFQKFNKLEVPHDLLEQLIDDPIKLEFINKLKTPFLKKAIFLYFAEVVSYVKSQKLNLETIQINHLDFDLLLEWQNSGKISGIHIKKIIPLLISTKKDLKTIIKENNFQQISDKKILSQLIDKIIIENKIFLQQNSQREKRVFKFVLGQLMKLSKGQANPVLATRIIEVKIGGTCSEKNPKTSKILKK